MPKLSIIIVNFNTKEILQDCLENLDTIYPNMEVIVVDNASSDGSSQVISSQYPWVKLIQNQENKGLAAANNAGLKASSGDYILYLGSDCFPAKNVLTGMLGYMEENLKVGIATCQLYLRDGSLDMDAHRGFPKPWAAATHFLRLNKLFTKSKIFNHYFMGNEDLSVSHEIELCISHFMLVRRAVFETIGNWDENFFLYGEDVDLCYRTKKAGWKIMYLPQWRALHYKGVSTGLRAASKDVTKASAETKLRTTRNTTEAMKMFYAKHYKAIYPALVTGVIFIGIDLMAKFRQAKLKAKSK